MITKGSEGFKKEFPSSIPEPTPLLLNYSCTRLTSLTMLLLLTLLAAPVGA